MAPVNRKPKGWVLPGFKYLGPFNPLRSGKARNRVDQAALRHDYAYDRYIKNKINPYFKFNKADQKLINDLESDSSIAGFIAKSAFKIKKAIAPTLNEPEIGPPKKGGFVPRKSDKGTKRALYFARSQGGKRAKPNNTEQMADAGAGADTATGGDQTPSGGAIAPMAGNSGPGTGGGGGGVGSVGVSTGGWVAGTYFSDNKVITTNTRQFYTPIYNGHLYKQINNETDNDTNWSGISTPWGFFNFNCYASHFSPQDWQRLTNEYRRWKPKTMKVQIYNLQIKQIISNGTDKQYNNDLTAGVHILVDGSHQFPYSQHPWDDSYLTELPYKIYKTPQYAYFQRMTGMANPIGDNNPHRWMTANAPLFLLETLSHEVLRTGEDTAFSFSMNCGWVNNDRAWCPPQADFNPLIQTRRCYLRRSGNQNTYLNYSPYRKPSNWVPGPGCSYTGSTVANDKQHAPLVTNIRVNQTVTNNGQIDQFTQQNQTLWIPTEDTYNKSGLATGPMNACCENLDNSSTAYDVTERDNPDLITSDKFDTDMTRWNNITFTYNNSNNESVLVRPQIHYMYPMQAWNSNHINRYNAIWDKQPNTDWTTIPASSDGTLPMSHPPGTIFIKVAKIPVPSENNLEDSYLNLYVTGQVSVEIEWEVERFQTKNWRAECKNDPKRWQNTQCYNVDTQGNYLIVEGSYEGMPTKMGIGRNN